ncbi:hypothetical protein ACUXIR_000698 [Staphylococcus hominis]
MTQLTLLVALNIRKRATQRVENNQKFIKKTSSILFQ